MRTSRNTRRRILKSDDLDNKNSYFAAGTNIRNEYERAMEQIVDMLKDKCKYNKLVKKLLLHNCNMRSSFPTNQVAFRQYY
jgi:hypothetical protein